MMIECTSDQWADFVSSFRTIQTEQNIDGFSFMHSELKWDRSTRIATVRYDASNNRTYYIDEHAAAEAEQRNPHNRMFPRL
jgi:hypothetical protein